MKRVALTALIFLGGQLGAGYAAGQHNHGGGHGGQPRYDCPLRPGDFTPALKNLDDGASSRSWMER